MVLPPSRTQVNRLSEIATYMAAETIEAERRNDRAHRDEGITAIAPTVLTNVRSGRDGARTQPPKLPDRASLRRSSPRRILNNAISSRKQRRRCAIHQDATPPNTPRGTLLLPAQRPVPLSADGT